MGKRVFIVLVASVLALTTIVFSVLAADGPVRDEYQPLRVEPSRFVFAGRPGEQITGAIYIANKGDGPATAAGVLSDWTLNSVAQIVVSDAGTLDSSLSDWIKFNPRRFRIQSDETQTVRFTIRIPHDAAPGERRGLIGFEQIVPYIGDMTGATTRIQVASTIYVSVLPVERKCEVVDARIETDQNTTSPRLLLGLKGTGTAHFRGEGTFEVYEASNRRLMVKGEFSPLVALPEVVTYYVGQWNGNLPKGTYHVVIKVTPSEPGQAIIKQVYQYEQK